MKTLHQKRTWRKDSVRLCIKDNGKFRVVCKLAEFEKAFRDEDYDTYEEAFKAYRSLANWLG